MGETPVTGQSEPQTSRAPASSSDSISGLPRVTTLPITYWSGCSDIWPGSQPSISSMPRARSWSLIGG